MTQPEGLEIGGFYWVIWANDPDATEPWEAETQPARYAGLDQHRGCHLWHALGVSSEDGKPSDWPVKWIGPRILSDASAGTEQPNTEATGVETK